MSRDGGAGGVAAGGAAPGGAAGGGTPLARKLGIGPGAEVHLRDAPDPWPIPGLPADCTVVAGDPPGADVTVVFHRSRAELAADAPALAAALADPAALWIAWPRRAAGHDSDITENDLREAYLPLGLVDVKVAALGTDWSGLKFVRRTELRDGGGRRASGPRRARR
ncbi:DUF3052 domain-containing protein [Streptomyces sp. NPDC093225]|uniref:DUF3052 domain-containing protein n=1 Tax=Streptomyces sp. NPDC093225 TaxID=3366034 RepID=UPI003808B975